MTPSGSPPRFGEWEDAPVPRGDEEVLGRQARTRLAELFDRHESLVFGFLLSRTGDRALSEDLTIETFLALARRAAHEPESIDGLSASSLVTIARRRLIDHWRSDAARRRRLDAVRAEVSVPSASRVPDAELEEADERVLAALESLPVRQRAALTLRHLDEMSVSEVSEILGSAYQATESLLARARRSFRTAYEERGESG